MQEILLIQPPVGPLDLYSQPEEKLAPDRLMWKRRLTRVPQGLLSIATWLDQHNFKVKIFDSRLHMINGWKGLEEDLRREIKQTNCFVGISVLTMHIPIALQISQLIRSESAILPIVWGGYHPTLYPEQTAYEKLVDFVVQGEGELPMQKLAECLMEGKSYLEVNGLAFKMGSVHVNPLDRPFDINMLETPNYDLLEVEYYLKKRSYNPPEDIVGLEYNGSRGCCFDCAFCINRVLPQQHKWRGKAASRVAYDIATLKAKYGIKYVFLEEEFPFVSTQRSLELARLLKPMDLHWSGNIRADWAVNNVDILRSLRSAGWCETSVGCESGSNRILQYLRKGITIEQIIETSKILNDLDVYALYSFMTDLPTETVDEKNQTFILMRKLKRIHPKSEFIGPQTYRLYPKTEWYNKEVEEGRFKEPSNLREWVTSGLSDFYAR